MTTLEEGKGRKNRMKNKNRKNNTKKNNNKKNKMVMCTREKVYCYHVTSNDEWFDKKCKMHEIISKGHLTT